MKEIKNFFRKTEIFHFLPSFFAENQSRLQTPDRKSGKLESRVNYRHKTKDKKIKKAVLDLGLQSSTKGNKLYAALKGVLDAGIEIPHDTKLFPSEERIKGEHLKDKKVAQDFEKLKNKLIK